MFDINLISFKRLTICDLSYMHKWLNNDFVIEWYGKKKWSFKEIEEKYIPYINNERPTQGYLVLYNSTPIGSIQTYKIHDYPDYAKFVDINENASGLDVFIGEQEYFHKGLGKYIISKFLKEIVFALSDSVSCILGPEPKNEIAIKTYEKVGFKYIKTIQVENELENIMRIAKNDVYTRAEVKLINISPVFVSENVRKTVNYYVEKLGFKFASHYDKIDNFASIYRDSIEFVIVQSKYGEIESNAKRYGNGYDAYINTATVEGVDIIYEEFKAKGAKISSEPRKTDYGSYEFVVEDIDGRFIGIGLIYSNEIYFKNSNAINR